jgi:LmbE family N-acetylglucosaminyl deacetylase
MTLSTALKKTALPLLALIFLICFVMYLSPLAFKRLFPQLSHSEKNCTRLLVTFAHADDELTNAGLIRHFADTGSQISLIVLTDGAANTESDRTACLKNETMTACRKRELENVGSMLGLDHIVFGNLPDSNLQGFLSEARQIVSKEMKDFQPDCLLTMEATGLNGNADHRAAHRAVKTAVADLDFDGIVYLSTLPWPMRFFLPSHLPNNSTDEIKIFSTNKRLKEIKVQIGMAHKSQAKTIRNITLGLGPSALFSWLDFETYSVHNANDLFE